MLDPSKKLDRTLMFILGALTWSMLLMPIWLGYFAPKAVSFVLTFLAIYWVFMAVKHAWGLIQGYRKYKYEISVDWYKKCKELNYKKLPNKNTLPKQFSDLKHFILIPTVTEGISILEPTLQAIMDQSYPKEKILIVIGTEEKGKKEITSALIKIKKKYKDKLPEILHYIHPANIPGEIVGVASPNRRWAAIHAVDEIKKRGENITDYIFTTYDSDGLIHKQLLARLAFMYLTDKKRFNRHYESAMHVFRKNYWKVPIASRIESANVTFGRLSNQGSETYRISETFSCYSTALDTLVAADYWDVKFIDDTVFFWRAFAARDGDFTGTFYFLPIYSDATGGSNYVRAHKNLFRQLIRWGWGSIATPIALKIFITKSPKKISLERRLLWAYVKLERHLLLRTSVFLITFGFTMLTLVNHQFKNSATVYNLPQVVSIFLSGGMVMFIPLAFIRRRIYPIPDYFERFKKFKSWFEGPFIIINLLTYSFIPFVYAETLMMLGKVPTVTFYTPKQR